MTPQTFETERLSIDDWGPALADPKKRVALKTALAAILTPPVLKPLPPPLQLSAADRDLDRWIMDRAAEALCSTVALRASQKVVGLLILAPGATAAPPDLHVGYLFSESAWGRGYASELVVGLVQSFDAGDPVRLIGGVARENPASARVLEKAGFHRDTHLSDGETDIFVRSTGS